jgi:RHS repeat-associated protein
VRVSAQWTRSVGGGAPASGTNIFINEPNSPASLSQVLEELPALGVSPSVTYTLGSRIVSQAAEGVVSHLLPDGHGSIRQLAATNGAPTALYSFDAYGNGLNFTNGILSPTATELLYCGGQFDANLQWYNQLARYYDPLVSRFNQGDPFSPNQQSGANLYAYAADDPVNGFDPMGLYELDVHRWLTQFIAARVGFDPSYAVNMGVQTQMLDDTNTVASITEGPALWDNMRLYHFVTKDRLYLLAMSINEQIDGQSEFYEDVGKFLHAQEDSFAHSSSMFDRNWHYYGGLGIFPNGGLVGHLFCGHSADWTFLYPNKAMRMAWRVYEDLTLIKANRNTYAYPANALMDDPTDESDPVWSGMKGTLLTFMTYSPNIYSGLLGLGAQVTQQGMITKIGLLGFSPNSFTLQDLHDIQQLPNEQGHQLQAARYFTPVAGIDTYNNQ